MTVCLGPLHSLMALGEPVGVTPLLLILSSGYFADTVGRLRNNSINRELPSSESMVTRMSRKVAWRRIHLCKPAANLETLCLEDGWIWAYGRNHILCSSRTVGEVTAMIGGYRVVLLGFFTKSCRAVNQ